MKQRRWNPIKKHSPLNKLLFLCAAISLIGAGLYNCWAG